MGQIEPYFANIGHSLDVHTNPAEFLLDLVSSDFGGHSNTIQNRVQQIQNAWTQAADSAALKELCQKSSIKESERVTDAHSRPGIGWVTLALLHRSFIKSYRDVVAYGIRIVMYLGMHQLDSINMNETNRQVWQL